MSNRMQERHGVNRRNTETMERAYKRSLVERGADYARYQREQDANYHVRQGKLNQDIRRHLAENYYA